MNRPLRSRRQERKGVFIIIIRQDLLYYFSYHKLMDYFHNKTKAMHDIQLLMDKYNSGKIINISRTVGGYTNINYKVSTDKRDYLLKIHIDKKVEDIVPEIKILGYLKTKDIPAAYPIPDSEKGFINALGNDNVVIYEFIDGHHPEVNIKTTKQIAKVAAALNLFPDNTMFNGNKLLSILDFEAICIERVKELRKMSFRF